MQEKAAQYSLIIPKWATDDGPANDVALSTRARLARNVEGIPFPVCAQEADLKRVADLVLGTISAGDDQLRFSRLAGKFKVVTLSQLSSTSMRLALIDAHMASRQHVAGGKHRLIVLDDAGSISLMVNEEDHLRIQCILPGFQPMTALQIAREFDVLLSRKIKYAQTDNYGYLTSSLANVGTGLRMSVMLHLPGLAYLDEAITVLTAAAELKVSVRGLLGEGTKALGDVYQVSNETTIGFTEREITSRIRAVAEHLISREREARRFLAGKKYSDVHEAARNAWVKLTEAPALSGERAMSHLSTLRLADALSLSPGISVREFKNFLVSMRLGSSASSDENCTSPLATGEDAARRAKLVRDTLLGVK